jgi:hypothetical protein
MLAKIRRMYFRDKLSIREIERQISLPRNTIRKWLREADMSEPRYRNVSSSKRSRHRATAAATVRYAKRKW